MQEEYANPKDFEEPKENKGFYDKLERFLESRYSWALIIILVAISSFCLGRISKIQEAKGQVRVVSEKNNPLDPPYIKGEIEQKTVTPEVQGATTVNKETGTGTEVVASKNGTKYHLPTCAGAKQISEKNKITFKSIEEARASGYTPAANCKGLK